jgi:hypothetical protein
LTDWKWRVAVGVDRFTKASLALGAIALGIGILGKLVPTAYHAYTNRPAKFSDQATCAELGHQFAEDWYRGNPESYRNAPKIHFNKQDQRCYVKMHYEPKGDEAHQAVMVYDAARGAGTLTVLALKALVSGPGLDQRPVHREVIGGKQLLAARLPQNLIKESIGHLALQQPLTILGKHVIVSAESRR